ncbi:Uncharacterised protein [Mycobacteroides abscessus subsp. abscessus]|uniref:hypothetical protein n=1 Tax=Mycobacteroides abscessus TaxID=36809 RepID=UPI00092817BA|nr:hypothetical protein [Mycobacteroides abscessus]SIC55651.1 Uncharacterised protein [Mycobacteroides abscessus subsp. abscessus]SKU58194.1 Uncharacterised protein [Mycobacteroides abscessus subsp. abscessus]
MPWFNVDDGFANSKPVMRIPRRYRTAAIGLWTLTGSWSAKELTDGLIPAEVVEEFGGTPKLVELLITSELWEPAENGVQFRNWSKWQRTKAQVLDFRAGEAERKRKQRERKAKPSDQEERNVSQPRPGGTPTGLRPESPPVSGLPKPLPKPLPISTYVGGDLALADAREPNNPPPAQCPKHPVDTGEPCRGCEAARQASEGVREQQRAQREAEQQAAHEAKIAAVVLCELCDDDGYRGTQVCDHVDRVTTAAKGAARARAALAKAVGDE